MASGARPQKPFRFLGPPRPEEDLATSSFQGVLFDRSEGEPGVMPAFFPDLHLDDIVSSVTAGPDACELTPFFYDALPDVEAVTYRHAVFRDLEDEALLSAVRGFRHLMQSVRRELDHATKASYTFDQERWLIRAARDYGSAITSLNDALALGNVRSTALRGFRDYLAPYAASDVVTRLAADTGRLQAMISRVSYRLRIHGPKATVTRFREEPDYSAEVAASFEKFRQGATKTYGWRFDEGSDMNHVEAAILERVARLYPEPFDALHDYTIEHQSFVDPTIARFDREIQFYLAWLDYIAPLRRAGLAFCYPEFSGNPRSLDGRGVFDLALATSLVMEGTAVIPNDVELREGERVLVVSGPNQGGKTTFARAIGQLHHLARLGVTVPGDRVCLPSVDQIFTHFERQERVEDLNSKLEDDLRRVRRLLHEATSESLVIMNESFTSTTLDDQLFIGKRVMARLLERGLMAVVVTFLDELSSLDPAIVSVVSQVDPDDQTRRTFKIVRRPADGLAYAMAIAAKYRLTYPTVKTRLGR